MPGRFDKFTGPARRALQLAQEEARPFHHTYIGAEHILAGLLRQKDDAANRVLAELGVEPSEVLSAIQSRLYGLQSPQAFQLFARIGKSRRRTLSARASEVIRLAVDEAGHLGHDHVGTEHLLLGLLREGTSEAVKMLAGLGVSLEAVRAQIEKVPHGDSEQPDTPEQPPAQDALAE